MKNLPTLLSLEIIVIQFISKITALIFIFAPTSTKALEPSNFIEDQQPFIRSALIVSEKPLNRVRRGVIISLGKNLWTCFDPDLLRHAAVWKTPDGKSPLSMDSMAAISYPDKKAKASIPPHLQGKIILTSPELPGAALQNIPDTDPRHTTLLQGTGKVGPMPSVVARWQGLSLRNENVILSYSVGTREIEETIRALTPDLIERIISLKPGKQTTAIRLSSPPKKTSGTAQSKFILLKTSGMPHLRITGDNPFETTTSSTEALNILIPPSTKPTLYRILQSKNPIEKAPTFSGFPKPAPAKKIFSAETKVSRSVAQSAQTSPLEAHDLYLPTANPWKRAIRPTDIAFTSDGTALITTLDGDVWRVTDIEKPTATWTRAAFGIFEPMSIAISPDDKIFTLGRDQITQLKDTNQDGTFDQYLCASDIFLQTLHTRDYATSLEINAEGDFIIARSGLVDSSKGNFNENAKGRGSILKISQDGTHAKVLADGLRVPFLGLRNDGALFASDQQGNFIPSSPIHLILDDTPYLGFQPSNFRQKQTPTPPLLWYPYQINRSGSSFVTLSEKAFPSLGETFAHLSWSGRIFPIETPHTGIPFSWKLPLDFDFPILAAATHPKTGKLYAVGIGISGYLPTTEKIIGLTEISEKQPIIHPQKLTAEPNSVTLTFLNPIPHTLSLTNARPELTLWNIQRTPQYGSGHYRWDGTSGEDSTPIEKLEISPDRKTVKLTIPEIYRSDILRLKLNIHDTTEKIPPYQIELYTSPSHLPQASPSDLITLNAREKNTPTNLSPGNANRGATIFTKFGCIGCHSLEGTKLTGPPLNGIATRHPENLKSYIRESILNPTAFITPGYEPAMPAFNGVIPPQDLEDLIEYISKL